jgi:hypothetical protein
VDWIDLAQDREQWQALVSIVMNLRVPYNVGKFLNSGATGGSSRRAQLHGVGWLVYIYTVYHELLLEKRLCLSTPVFYLWVHPVACGALSCIFIFTLFTVPAFVLCT